MSVDIYKVTGNETGKETETETETEIEIPIENQEPENQPQKTTSKEPQTKVKDISKLTLEERAKIISDARNGIPSEHYDVIVLKNGNTRIVKKKIKTPSLSNRLINEQKQEVNNSKKLYMSDNQLMMEHIIELNNQVNKLANKHKKLKKKYRALKHDIYEEDIEQENEKGTSFGLERSSSIRFQAPSQALVQEPQSQEQQPPSQEPQGQEQQQPSKEPQSQEPQPPSQEMRRTWRSYLTYL